MGDTVLFDQAPEVVRQIVRELRDELQGLQRITAIRDLFGRLRFLVDCRPPAGDPLAGALDLLANRTHQRLGARAYPPVRALLFADEIALEPPFAQGLLLDEGPPEVRLVDSQVTGQLWTPSAEPAPSPEGARRISFFSLKGGVGRSTAVAITAWSLARSGRRVLVVDLDLEAPGVSSLLVPREQQPGCGIVDWFVEDAVGQGEEVLGSLLAAAPLSRDLPGEIRVVPSHGQVPGDYLAKLGRCYLDLPARNGLPHETWDRRLVRLVERLEEFEQPDVVLFDVRAGLSDLSSVAVTALGADVLLFALDTDQTWVAYGLLFEHWRRSDAIRSLRERLQIVAALVPETERSAYLERLRQHAWDLFTEQAYDLLEPNRDESLEPAPFSFDLQDDAAPHAPLPISWNRGLDTLGNLHTVDETLVQAAFGAFLERIRALLSPPDQESP